MNIGMKYLPAEEFRAGGYLHEVNRLLLHPLGLALELPANGSDRFRVWDCRDEAEGIYFGDDLLSPEKAGAVMKEMMDRRETRIAALGWVLQPIRGQRVLTVNYTDPDAAS